jgi:hypothetical protein
MAPNLQFCKCALLEVRSTEAHYGKTDYRTRLCRCRGGLNGLSNTLKSERSFFFYTDRSHD